jgi:hypothetical protein
VAAAAVWVSSHSGAQRTAPVAVAVLPSLAETIDAVSEVRLARGDGTATTLVRGDKGWIVAQRKYPADQAKLRALLIGLSTLRPIEEKTSDPARYAVLDVEDANDAKSHSVRVDVAAASRTWSLLIGKPSGSSATFVRAPGSAAAWLVQPRIDADPQPARWIATNLLDVSSDRVQQVSISPAGGPSYALARERQDVPDLALRAVPPGRKPASAAVIGAVAGALTRLNAEDVRDWSPAAPEHPSRARFRMFDGLQLDLDGYREGIKTWVRINASVDQATARRFASGKPTPQNGQAPDAEAAAINAHAQAHDFELPAYKYDAIFRPLEELLAPRTARTDHTLTAGSKKRK